MSQLRSSFNPSCKQTRWIARVSETPPRSNFGRFSLIGAPEAAMSVVLPVPGRKWIASKTYLT
jgi:hypothetical protein